MRNLKKIALSFTAGMIMFLCLPFHLGADEIIFDFTSRVRDNPFKSGESRKKDETTLLPCPEYELRGSDIRLGEFYTSLQSGDFEFRLGRQKHHTGTGFAWNPSDVFNTRKIWDPSYDRRKGLDSAYLSYSFGEEYEISTFYSFETFLNKNESESDAGNYQVRMKTHTDVLDLAIHYSEAKRNSTDYEGLLSGEKLPGEAVVPVRYRLVGAGLSSEIGRLGVHAEGGYAWLTLGDDADQSFEEQIAKEYSSFLVGIDYVFENHLYLILEYYQEGRGKTSPDEYTLNERLAYIFNERNAIGRDNVFVGAKYPIAKMTSLEFYNIINANDPSLILNP